MQAQARKEKSQSILVVDDDGPILRALTVRLKHAGYRVLASRDASSALASLDDTPPAVALLDINMPGLDGFRLAEELQRKAPDCHCMFLTASKAQEHHERAAGLGIDIIEKPFEARELLERIGGVCG